jgi:hypothetical protein
MKVTLAICMVVVACVTLQGEERANVNPFAEKAMALFTKLTTLGNSFDPAIADLYADDARIQNKRTYPDGTVRAMTMPAPQYKHMMRQVMPLAKARGDTDSFTNTTFTVEGTGVRIKTTRHSNLKNYDSPYELLVSPSTNGIWLIREEISESRP